MIRCLSITLLLSFILNIFFPPVFKTQTKWNSDSKGKKKHIAEVTWNKQGDIFKWIEYNDGLKAIVSEFSYDYSLGKKIKKVDLRSREYTLYSYDKSGRLVQEITYNSAKKIQKKEIHTYKGVSKYIAYTDVYYPTEPTPIMRTEFQYYTNNMLKKAVQTTSDTWYQTNEYKYDTRGHLIFETAIVDGGVGLVKYYYTYNGDTLVKDVINVPDTGIEYHIYEINIQ